MSDKELDEFFRQASEQYDIPYQPKAWNRMRGKLDGPGGAGGKAIKISLGIALLALLCGTIVWLQPSADTPAVQTHRKEPVNTAPAAPKQTPQETAETQPGLQPSSAAQLQRMNEGEEKSGNPPQEGPVEQAGAAMTSPAAKGSLRTGNTGTSPALAATARTGASLSVLPAQPLGFNAPPAMASLGPSDNPMKLPAVGLSVAAVAALPQQQDTLTAVVPEAGRFQRLGLHFFVSPDLSAVGLHNITHVGTKSGVALEYFIFRNLSVYTGLIYSHKIYTARDGYEPSPGYWDKYPKPNSIEAQCNVLDIPVNLRYYAFNWKKSRLYVSGGLSSYLMLKEEYDYRYAPDAGYQYAYSVQNRNRHYFKVSNLSVGFERALGQRWALQAEPFVKIPLAGVGEGNIRLSTAGLFLTATYKFLLKH